MNKSACKSKRESFLPVPNMDVKLFFYIPSGDEGKVDAFSHSRLNLPAVPPIDQLKGTVDFQFILK
jgi:hypothetical protein